MAKQLRTSVGFNAILVVALALAGCSKEDSTSTQTAASSAANSTSVSSVKAVVESSPGPEAVIQRANDCLHFAGEFAGDKSERDKELNRKMGELKCDSIEDDLNALHIDSSTKPELAAKIGQLRDQFHQ